MSLNNSTKKLIAHTLETMLETTPFDKIRVTNLCRLADIQPRVFYYHFENLSDLGAWIFESNLHHAYEGASIHDRLDRDKHISILEKQLEGMWAKRTLYQKLYNDSSQGNLMEYTIKRNVEEEEKGTKCALGTATLSEHYRRTITFASHGTVGIIVDWLNNKADFTSQGLATFLYDTNSRLLAETSGKII